MKLSLDEYSSILYMVYSYGKRKSPESDEPSFSQKNRVYLQKNRVYLRKTWLFSRKTESFRKFEFLCQINLVFMKNQVFLQKNRVFQKNQVFLLECHHFGETEFFSDPF